MVGGAQVNLGGFKGGSPLCLWIYECGEYQLD